MSFGAIVQPLDKCVEKAPSGGGRGLILGLAFLALDHLADSGNGFARMEAVFAFIVCGKQTVRLLPDFFETLGNGKSLPVEIVVAGGELALVKWAIPRLQHVLPQLSKVVRFRNMRSLEAIHGSRRGEVDLVLSSVKPLNLGVEEQAQKLSEGEYLIVSGGYQDVATSINVAEAVRLPLVLLEGMTPVRMALEMEAKRQGKKLNIQALGSTYEQVLTIVSGCDLYAAIPGVCRSAAKSQKLEVRNLVAGDKLDYSIWILTASRPMGDLKKVLSALS